MGGWYAKEINTIDNLKGLKIRISGFGAAVMKAARAAQPQRYTEKSITYLLITPNIKEISYNGKISY